MRYFAFTWKIENWNMLYDWELDSPVFVVPDLPHERWHLKTRLKTQLKTIRTKGKDDKDQTFLEGNLELCRSRDGYGDQDKPVTIGTYTEILHMQGESISDWIDAVDVEDSLQLLNWSIDVVNIGKEVLTLRCTLSWEAPEDTPSVPEPSSSADVEEWCSVSDGVWSQRRCSPTHCTVHTRIELFRWSFLWTVKDMDLTDPSRESAIRLESVLSHFGTFELTLFYEKDGPIPRLWFEVRRMVSDNTKKTFTKCSLKFLVKNNKRISFGKESVHLFSAGSSDTWVLESNTNAVRSRYKRNVVRDLIHEENNMRIEVELSAAHQGCHRHLLGPPQDDLDAADSALLSDFHRLYKDGVKDFKLRSRDGKEVHANKIILCARSPFFRTMLTTKMKESDSGRVDLHYDADVLECMVHFMSGGRPDMTPDVALNLFMAADTYLIPSLRSFCLAFLRFNMTVETVLEILWLAKFHKEQDLLNSAKEFVRSHLNLVLQSEKWKNLHEHKLAREVVLEIRRDKNEDELQQ